MNFTTKYEPGKRIADQLAMEFGVKVEFRFDHNTLDEYLTFSYKYWNGGKPCVKIVKMTRGHEPIEQWLHKLKKELPHLLSLEGPLFY